MQIVALNSACKLSHFGLSGCRVNNMCGRVFVIAVIASFAVPSVAEEIAEVDSSGQFKLVRKRGVVTAASAVNAGAAETGNEALVVEAGKEESEGDAHGAVSISHSVKSGLN